jgi:hypothetical protein
LFSLHLSLLTFNFVRAHIIIIIIISSHDNNNKSKNKIISSPLILGGRAISGHYGNGLSNGGSGHYGYGHIGPYVRHPQTTLLPLLLHRYSYCFFVLISHLTNISFYFINIIGASAEASSWNPSPYVTSIFFLFGTFHIYLLFIYLSFIYFALILAGALCFFMLFPFDFFVCFCLHDFLLEIAFRNSLE